MDKDKEKDDQLEMMIIKHSKTEPSTVLSDFHIYGHGLNYDDNFVKEIYLNPTSKLHKDNKDIWKN